MRKAFNFYGSYWDQMKLLNDKQKLELFEAICSVQFLEINIDDIKFNDKISMLVWTGIRHSVETSLNGFINKKKALDKVVNIPLAKGGTEDPCQQEEEKEEEKEKEQVQKVKKETKKDFVSRTTLETIYEYPKLNPEAFTEWMQHKRYDRKNEYTKNARFLSTFNHHTQQDIVDTSIRNGWKGLFSPEKDRRAGKSTKKTLDRVFGDPDVVEVEVM